MEAMTTAAAHKPAARPSALAIFTARCEARALLWAVGEIDLHPAIDELWAAAVRDGLVRELGADRVQRILADTFAPVRVDLSSANAESDDAIVNAGNGADSANAEPTDNGSTFDAACRKADEKQARKPPDPHLEKLRELMADEVSLESAWRQVSRPLGVPIATLWTAEYLVQQGDTERFRRWLERHSAEQRIAIRKHLEAKRCH
jgi:hypothetical protein